MAIVNANVPNMVGGISHEMAMAGLNIATMTNKSERTGVHAGGCGQRRAGFGDQGDRDIDGVLMVRYLPSELTSPWS